MASKQYLDLDGLSLYDRLIKDYIRNNGGGVIVKSTYAELLAMRDNSELTPGQLYQMTDYETVTVQEDTRSAGHQFDLILLATKENEFCSQVMATRHEGDTYFQYCDLTAWKILYKIDNDAEHYFWVDPVNGKGVIYWMRDETGNECDYDFKNIQFKRYYVPEEEFFYTPESYYTGPDELYGGQSEILMKLVHGYWNGTGAGNSVNNNNIPVNSPIRIAAHRILSKDDMEMLKYDFEMQGLTVPDLDPNKRYAWLLADSSYRGSGYGGKAALLELSEYNARWYYTFSYNPNNSTDPTTGSEDITVVEETRDLYAKPQRPRNNVIVNNNYGQYISDGTNFEAIKTAFLPQNIIFCSSNQNGKSFNKIIDCMYCTVGVETNFLEMYNCIYTYAVNTEMRRKSIEFCNYCIFILTPEKAMNCNTCLIGNGEGRINNCRAVFLPYGGNNTKIDIENSSCIGTYYATSAFYDTIVRDCNYVINSHTDGHCKNNGAFNSGELIHVNNAYVIGAFNKIRYTNNIILWSSYCTHTYIGYSSSTFGGGIDLSCKIQIYQGNANKFEAGCREITLGTSFSSTSSYMCNNNKFGKNCENITLNNGCLDNEIGDGSKNITLGTQCYHNIFGRRCGSADAPINLANYCNYNIFGEECRNVNFENSCENNKFGKGCTTVSLTQQCKLNTFGNFCNFLTITNKVTKNLVGNNSGNLKIGGFFNIIESNCNLITIGDNANRNTFRNGCSQISLEAQCNNNEIDTECSRIYLYSTSSDNKIGKACTHIHLTNCFSVTFEGNDYHIDLVNVRDTYFGYACGWSDLKGLYHSRFEGFNENLTVNFSGNLKVTVLSGCTGYSAEQRLDLYIGSGVSYYGVLVYMQDGLGKYICYRYSKEMIIAYKWKDRIDDNEWHNG